MSGFIHIPQMSLPYECRYPARVGVVIEWPLTVEHAGQTYCRSGKLAAHKKTGMPCAGYHGERDARLWLYCDGHIEED
jgi:hypothetical protein